MTIESHWKPIPSTDGYYEAAPDGRIRRAKPGPRTRVGRLLKHTINAWGYPSVYLCFEKTRIRITVHRLIAETFIGPIAEGMHVNHIDGVKTNCDVSNLEIVTPLENSQHAVRMGLVGNFKGVKNPRAKLTPDKVRELRRLRAEGWTLKALGERYGVTDIAVRYAALGKTWSHIT